MKKSVYSITNYRRKMAFRFGKHRKSIEEIVEAKNIDGVTIKEEKYINYQFILARRVIIILNIDNNNAPIVLKSWKLQGKIREGGQLIRMYIDIDGHSWSYIVDNMGEWLTYYNNVIPTNEELETPQNVESKFYHYNLLK